MRITAQLIIHCILPIDGIDGEGRIERMSPKGIKKTLCGDKCTKIC